MYIQCKSGFIEADLWDGSPIPVRAQQARVKKLGRCGRDPVIIVRSRSMDTLRDLAGSMQFSRGRPPKVYESPPGWDYQFRFYVTQRDFATILAHVAYNVDYRNFKSWCSTNSRTSASYQAELAHAIWHAAARGYTPDVATVLTRAAGKVSR